MERAGPELAAQSPAQAEDRLNSLSAAERRRAPAGDGGLTGGRGASAPDPEGARPKGCRGVRGQMDPRVSDPVPSDPQPTDADRYPTLIREGRRMLELLLEHPNAPIFRNQSGNRLTGEDVARVRAFERGVLAARVDGDPSPPWLPEHIARCYDEVPHYLLQGSPPRIWPTCPP